MRINWKSVSEMLDKQFKKLAKNKKGKKNFTRVRNSIDQCMLHFNDLSNEEKKESLKKLKEQIDSISNSLDENTEEKRLFAKVIVSSDVSAERFENLSGQEKLDLFVSITGKVTHKMEEHIGRLKEEKEKIIKRDSFERSLYFHKMTWLKYLCKESNEKPEKPFLS